MIEELEVQTFERPRRLRLIGESRGMHYERDHVIDRLQIGSRLMLIFRSRAGTEPARAAQDFIAPFMQINLRDELERDFVDFAAAASELSFQTPCNEHPLMGEVGPRAGIPRRGRSAPSGTMVADLFVSLLLP